MIHFISRLLTAFFLAARVLFVTAKRCLYEATNVNGVNSIFMLMIIFLYLFGMALSLVSLSTSKASLMKKNVNFLLLLLPSLIQTLKTRPAALVIYLRGTILPIRIIQYGCL